MDRRAFLRGMVATAAGILVPGGYEQRVWALDRTMLSGRGARLQWTAISEIALVDKYAMFEALLANPVGDRWVYVGEEPVRLLDAKPDALGRAILTVARSTVSQV